VARAGNPDAGGSGAAGAGPGCFPVESASGAASYGNVCAYEYGYVFAAYGNEAHTMGRKPIGQRALTPAEKQQRYRDRLKNNRRAAPPHLIDGAVIRQCFENAMAVWRGESPLQMPAADRCENIADLMASCASLLGTTPGGLPYKNTLRYARLFVHHAGAARASIEERLSAIEEQLPAVGDLPSSIFFRNQDMLADLRNIDGAAKFLRRLIDRRQNKNQRPVNARGLASLLAVHTMAIFAPQSESQSFQLSPKTARAVYTFVSVLLNHSGVPRTPAAVSAMIGKRLRSLMSGIRIDYKSVW
jgi:hypothetical protein